MGDSLGHKAMKGTIWASADRIANMCLQFGVNLILARLLVPDDFGAIGMIEIFITVAQVLVDGGFASALIQKKNPTQTDYSTIFYWNIIIAIVLYLAIFASSSFVSDFFRLPVLKNVLRVIGLIVITNALSIIQSNRLRKQLAFNKLAIANLSSYIITGTLAISAASMGAGVWSLVILQLGYSTLLALILWIITKWKPSFELSKKSMKELFGFGGYFFAATLLQEICKNIQGVIIGRHFSAKQVGLYSQATKLDKISSYTLPNILVQVMYPVYASIQDEDERLVEMLRMNSRLISFVIFPIMAILILIAEPLITFLYGAKWIACAPYFQILCVGGLFVCLQNPNFYAIAAKGKSRTLFLWSFYKWGFLITALFVGISFSMEGLLWAMAISNLNIYLINAFLSAKHVGYNLQSQMKDTLPILTIAIICMAIMALLKVYIPHHFMISVIAYIAIFITCTIVCKLKVANEIKMLFTRLMHR
jgi:O-antigen/teichoic acid export membrane protein